MERVVQGDGGDADDVRLAQVAREAFRNEPLELRLGLIVDQQRQLTAAGVRLGGRDDLERAGGLLLDQVTKIARQQDRLGPKRFGAGLVEDLQ